jgi:hypothetical protein
MTMRVSIRLRAALSGVAFVLGLAALPSSAQEAVRPEVGNPLKAAQGLTKSGKHREALAKVAEAEAVGGRTAYESFLIQQMKGSVAAAAGDTDTAIKAFETVIASGRLSGTDQLRMIQALAGMHYRNKDYPKAITWAARYRKEGGTDPSMRTVLLQSYFLTSDCASVSKMVGEGENGRKVTEEELQILANCHLKQKDTAGYVAAIERLVVNYPKREYWTDLLNRVQKKPGFSDRLSLDVFRLKMATGNITSTADYMEMAQLALQAGFPAEAKVIVDKGYAAGALGKGAEAERHNRLKNLVLKTLDEFQKARASAEQEAAAAKDGNDLVKIGVNYVYEGKADKGIGMIEQGIKKGGLKRPEDAKLQLGEAMIQGGQRTRAVQVLKNVSGTDGTADLARLWTLHAQRS